MKMTDIELYNYSKSLDMLSLFVKQLKEMHVYRYSKFIDSSKRGFGCSFAVSSKRFIPEEHQVFLELLNNFREVADLFEAKYKEEILSEQEREE